VDETDAIFHQPSLGICTVEVNKHSAKGKKFLELIETCRGNYRTAYALCSLFTSANIGPINPIQFKYMRTQGNAVHAASCIQSHPGNTSSSINQFMQSHGINITVGDLTKDDLVQLAVSGTNLPYSLADKPDGFADRYSIPGRSGLSYREGLQLRYQSEGENAYDFTGEVPDFLQFALTLLTYQQETMMCNGRIPQKIKKNSAALG